MADDQLDRETSVSAEVTETGIKATAKSRFVAALDRLGGAVVDNLNARIEGSTDRKRAKTKGEVRLIENIVEYGVQQLGASPEFAERAFNTHFRKVLAAQENKDHVLIEARRDLEENPPVEEVEGHISEDFFARFETYAEGASSDDLRKLFGRVLAGEIRRPGSITPATLHFASVLDQETAGLIDRVLPYCEVSGMAFDLLMNPHLSVAEAYHLTTVGFWATGTQLNLNVRENGKKSLRVEDHGVLTWEADKILGDIGPTCLLSPAAKGLASALAVPFAEGDFARWLIKRGARRVRYYRFKVIDGKESLDWGREYTPMQMNGVRFQAS